MKKTTVIGIAGGSASGKSTLAAELEGALSAYTVKRIGLDSYYKSENELPLVTAGSGREYRDFNCPDSFQWERLKADLRDADGEYDVILVEGLLTLWEEEICASCDLRVYVECPADIRIIRRIMRNLTWGLTLCEITDVYLDLVRYRHEEYVAPSAAKADMIVDSTHGLGAAPEAILRRAGLV